MSSIELKYYKYIDVSNKELSKTVGITIHKRLAEGIVRALKGADGVRKLVVLYNKINPRTDYIKPKIDGLVEITKAEYDSLDVSKESKEASEARTRYEIFIKRLSDKYDNKPDKTMYDHLPGYAKATGIPAATPEEAKILLAKVR